MTTAPMARWSGWGCTSPRARTCRANVSGGSWRSRRCWPRARWSGRSRFANNDRPGIMLASAVRTYLNRYGVVPGKRVTLFANNDEARGAARDLMAAGVHGGGDHRPAPRCLQRSRIARCMWGPRSSARAGGWGCAGSPVRKGGEIFEIETDLSGDVGRLEPDAAPDLPHERPAPLERGACGLRADGGRGAGAGRGGGGEWVDVDARRCWPRGMRRR